MPKKIDIPVDCTCQWERRTFFLRNNNGSRTEDEQAELTKLDNKCPVHKKKI